ncbi:MAG: hydantoinase/oxoprolinase family protein [Betaproteobacteria bacterium]|nr:hydantoinase/oxoprolinase family protein [Betaproteobacteria bacterium]
MSFFIGIDIGGTFTDCVVLDHEGRIAAIAKSPTRRASPDEGVINAVAAAARRLKIEPGALLADCRFFVHGCTVATNAIVERKGVRTALLTTRGHEDAIFIGKASQKVAGRSEREMNHQSHLDKAEPPIVAPRDVFGISERIDAHGDVVVALNEDELTQAIAAMRDRGIESVAISFLWSFVNNNHERQVRERVEQALPGVYVCVSHELAPLIGEYERTATTVANAYVGPKLIGYLDRLGRRLVNGGYRYPLLLAHCMGGLTTMEEIRLRPLLSLDSGPVSGVLGARYFGAVYGEPDIICADMGGTTFDVALIEGGNTNLDEEPVIDRYTCLIPKVAVESVGAGGGSIVWCDDNGLLRVGPHSAGAEPGPACYGAGGSAPTVTDVNLLLGYLNPEAFLGGEMRLDRAAAERALAQVAARAGMDTERAAAGAFTIVNANMADLIRRSTIDRGRDARDFVLFAYGGAGALHIAYLARDLGVKKIYVPSFATVFSALGMLTGGIVHGSERSSLAAFPMAEERWRELGGLFDDLEEGLGALFAREGIEREARRYARFAHVKYRLQPRALAVPVIEDFAGADSQDRLLAAFRRQYAALYGENAGYGAASIEIVKCRVEGSADMVLPRLAAAATVRSRDAASAKKSMRDVYLVELGAKVSADVYEGERLAPGMRLAGPAIIERMGDTILLPTFTSGTVDGFGNIVIELQTEPQ